MLDFLRTIARYIPMALAIYRFGRGVYQQLIPLLKNFKRGSNR